MINDFLATTTENGMTELSFFHLIQVSCLNDLLICKLRNVPFVFEGEEMEGTRSDTNDYLNPSSSDQNN